MRRSRWHVVVGCVCFVAGSGFGGWACLHFAQPSAGRLAERAETRKAPPVVDFDVYSTSPNTPAAPVYKMTLSVVGDEGEAMVVRLGGGPRINLIVCRDGGAVNPCGPEGVVPQESGIAPPDDRLSGGEGPGGGDDLIAPDA